MSDPVSIAELEQWLEGWPTKWTPVLEDSEFVGFDHNLNDFEATEGLVAFGNDYDQTLAEFLATMVNAMPALLGVAKSALEFASKPGQSGDVARYDALIAALTKVTP
jgi:hypothetical protein